MCMGEPCFKGVPWIWEKGNRSRHNLDKPCGRCAGCSPTTPFTGGTGVGFQTLDDLSPPSLFLDFHALPHSISSSWRACGSQRRPDSTSPPPRNLAHPTSPFLSLSFPGPASGCSSAGRPRGGSVGLALALPGAARWKLCRSVKGRKLFPSRRAGVARLRSSRPSSRRRPAPPPATCPNMRPDRGGVPRVPPASLPRFLIVKSTRLTALSAASTAH